MAYGHAERNLALIRQLEAETAQLLGDVAEPNPEQSAWQRDVASQGKPTVTLSASQELLDGSHAGQRRDRGPEAATAWILPARASLPRAVMISSAARLILSAFRPVRPPPPQS
jgi:hypothetical protein